MEMSLLPTWLEILVYPFKDMNFLWRMIPVYFYGIFSPVFTRKPNNSSAFFSGFIAIWTGLDWIRGYMTNQLIAHSLNWAIAIAFVIYGSIALFVGLKKISGLYFIFGRRSILTYFAILFYPIQAAVIFGLTADIFSVIFIMAIPCIVLLEIFAFILRKVLKTQEDEVSD